MTQETVSAPPPKPPPPEGPASKVAEQPPAPAPPETPVASQKPWFSYLPESVAAALSYLFGWIGGLFFLLFDPRPFVRYHAAQSVVVFGTLSLLLVLLGGFFLGAFFPGAEGLLMVLQRIVEVTWLVLAVFLIFKASSGKRFRVPYAARYADQVATPKS